MTREQVPSPLSSQSFRWLLSGRAVDQFGNAVQPIALGFAMLAVFETTTALGVVVGANAIGQILLLLAGGVVGDRASRSLVLVWSNVVAALSQGGVVVLVLTDTAVLPAYAVLAFVTGAAAAFDGPTTVALVPEVVSPRHLNQANGHLTLARQAASIGGAPVAGVLVATVGAGWTLAIDSASFLVAAGCFGRIAPLATTPARLSSPLEDLVDGWREFTSHTWVWSTIIAAAIVNAVMAGGFFVVGLAIADRTIGADGWGVVMGVFGVGALVGAFVAGRHTAQRPLLVGMLLTTTLSLPLFALAAGPSLPILCAGVFVSAAAVMSFTVMWETALQQHVRPDRLARVSAIDHLGSKVAVPVGAFVAGPLADAHGDREVVAVGGIVVVVTALATLFSRSIRQLRAHSDPPRVPGVDADPPRHDTT